MTAAMAIAIRSMASRVGQTQFVRAGRANRRSPSGKQTWLAMLKFATRRAPQMTGVANMSSPSQVSPVSCGRPGVRGHGLCPRVPDESKARRDVEREEHGDPYCVDEVPIDRTDRHGVNCGSVRNSRGTTRLATASSDRQSDQHVGHMKPSDREEQRAVRTLEFKLNGLAFHSNSLNRRQTRRPSGTPSTTPEVCWAAPPCRVPCSPHHTATLLASSRTVFGNERLRSGFPSGGHDATCGCTAS